jgi:hypothetical protein
MNIANVSPDSICNLSTISLGMGTIRDGLMPGLAARTTDLSTQTVYVQHT